MTDVSKFTAYVAVGPSPTAETVTKFIAYVITGPPVVPGALRIQTWTFTLDDHDYFVIQLADTTLVYDFAVGQWYTWGSGLADGHWRVVRGITWNANIGAIMKALSGSTMSSVLVGDGTNGALYFLDPMLSEDDSELGVPGQAFSRVITGELAVRGHTFFPCAAVEVTSSAGEAPGGLVSADVELTISDDKGHNYWSAGVETVASGVYDVTLAWRSLGSFTGPGRLFRITDYGALARIDGLDIPDGR